MRSRLSPLAALLAGLMLVLSASGLLWIRRSAYVGGDFPSLFSCEGTWYEEQDGVVVFTYRLRDVLTLDRLTILSVDELEMRCRLVRTE